MLTLKDILMEVSKEGRVCPKPDHWNKLWALLPNRQQKGTSWEPPMPLILGAWWNTSDNQKRERLYEHIRWAEQHGALDSVGDFLIRLNPEDWHRGE